MNKYFIYLRVSTEKQETTMQQDLAMEWLKKNERHAFSHVFYIDENVSSQRKIERRPQLSKMLADLSPGVKVLVYNSDRLARKVIEVFQIYEMIKEAGAQLFSQTEPEITDPLYMAMMSGFAQKTHERIRENVRNGLKSKKIRGERWGSNIPYGYEMDMNVKIPIKSRDGVIEWKYGKLMPNEREMQIVDKIREMSLMELSLKEMTRILNAQGFLNRAGHPFQKMTVSRIAKRQEMEPALQC